MWNVKMWNTCSIHNINFICRNIYYNIYTMLGMSRTRSEVRCGEVRCGEVRCGAVRCGEVHDLFVYHNDITSICARHSHAPTYFILRCVYKCFPYYHSFWLVYFVGFLLMRNWNNETLSTSVVVFLLTLSQHVMWLACLSIHACSFFVYVQFVEVFFVYILIF